MVFQPKEFLVTASIAVVLAIFIFLGTSILHEKQYPASGCTWLDIYAVQNSQTPEECNLAGGVWIDNPSRGYCSEDDLCVRLQQLEAEDYQKTTRLFQIIFGIIAIVIAKAFVTPTTPKKGIMWGGILAIAIAIANFGALFLLPLFMSGTLLIALIWGGYSLDKEKKPKSRWKKK
jgi:uncharacterized membrane protein